MQTDRGTEITKLVAFRNSEKVPREYKYEDREKETLVELEKKW